MTDNDITLAELVTEYLSSLRPAQRADEQQELMRFVRYYGSDFAVARMDMRRLEGYLGEVEQSGADSTRRLTPLRSLLIYAEHHGYSEEKLSKLVRIRRVGGRAKRAGSVTEAVEREVIQLTRSGYDQLKAELDKLSTEGRQEVADALLEARRDKDIRENAPYDAAKQQQAYIEARIRELEHVMAVAEVIDDTPGPVSGRIGIGTTVLLRDLAEDDLVRYTLVSSSEANPREGKLSVASPVGKALMDNSEGAVLEVEAPAGSIRYRIEQVEW